MWRGVILHFIGLVLVLIQAAPSKNTIKHVEESSLHCNRFCNNFKAEADFEEASLTCKCYFVKALDDAEMMLLKKNAKLLNLNVKISQPRASQSNTRIKRRIPRNDRNTIVSQDDDIVGQSLPLFTPQNRPLFGPHKPTLIQPKPLSVIPLRPSPLLPQKPLIAPNLPLQPISHHDAVRTLTDLRQKVRNLSRNSQIARNSEAHINAIRASLDNLSKRISLNPDHQARIAANRARIAHGRTVRINSRILPGKGLLPRSGLVGSSANNGSTTLPPQQEQGEQNPNDVSDEDEDIVPTDFHKPIITQPKEFYDD